MNPTVRNIRERIVVMRDEASRGAESVRNVWTGRDIRGTMNELLLTSLDACVRTLDDVLKAIDAEVEP